MISASFRPFWWGGGFPQYIYIDSPTNIFVLKNCRLLLTTVLVGEFLPPPQTFWSWGNPPSASPQIFLSTVVNTPPQNYSVYTPKLFCWRQWRRPLRNTPRNTPSASPLKKLCPMCTLFLFNPPIPSGWKKHCMGLIMNLWGNELRPKLWVILLVIESMSIVIWHWGGRKKICSKLWANSMFCSHKRNCGRLNF